MMTLYLSRNDDDETNKMRATFAEELSAHMCQFNDKGFSLLEHHSWRMETGCNFETGRLHFSFHKRNKKKFFCAKITTKRK